MKAVVLLMAIFLLGLSMIPCADDAVAQNSIETIADNSEDHDHESESDLCSPFCVCHCCHSHFTTIHFYNATLIAPTLLDQNTDYNDHLTIGHQMSILQPPRV